MMFDSLYNFQSTEHLSTHRDAAGRVVWTQDSLRASVFLVAYTPRGGYFQRFTGSLQTVNDGATFGECLYSVILTGIRRCRLPDY